jgi:hypothetical protein
MLSWPMTLRRAMGVFAPVFSCPVWPHVKVLMVGAVRAPGKPTVIAIVQLRGRRAASNFQTSHRVLNRARESPLTAGWLALMRLVAVFSPSGASSVVWMRPWRVVAAIRSPPKALPVIACALPARMLSKAGALRWRACMVLALFAWADHRWALPVLMVLYPSARCATGPPPVALDGPGVIEDPAPGALVAGAGVTGVADRGLAVLERRAHVKMRPCARVITRLRLEAGRSRLPCRLVQRGPAAGLDSQGNAGRRWERSGRRSRPAGPRGALRSGRAKDGLRWRAPRTVPCRITRLPCVARRWILIRDPKKVCKPQVVLSTNQPHTPEPRRPWLVRRGTREVTFEAARAPRGMKPPRPWNERAVARTTPALLRLYSSIMLTAHLLIEPGATCARSRVW